MARKVKAKRGKRKQSDVQRMVRMNINSLGRLLENIPHTFMRYTTSDIIIDSNDLAQTLGGIQFTLGSVQNSSELTALYDQYRILKVDCRFRQVGIQMVDQLSGSTAANQFRVPQMFIHTDYDDAAAPSNISQIKQRPQTRVFAATKSFTHSLTPRYANAVFQSGLTTAYGQGKKYGWVDAAYPDVQHYGIKYGLESTGSASGPNQPKFTYAVTVRYLIQCRGQR